MRIRVCRSLFYPYCFWRSRAFSSRKRPEILLFNPARITGAYYVSHGYREHFPRDGFLRDEYFTRSLRFHLVIYKNMSSRGCNSAPKRLLWQSIIIVTVLCINDYNATYSYIGFMH